MRHHRFVLALAAALLMPAAYAEAGSVFVMETTGAGDGADHKMQTRMSVEAPNLLVDVIDGAAASGSGTNQFIFLGDKSQMIVIDHGTKTYAVMDKETVKQMSAMMGGGMEEMIQEALKDVPEDQRAEIEKMMREQMGKAGMGQGKTKASPVEYGKTGKTGDQQGFPCVEFVAKRDGVVIRELWVTEWSNLKGGDEARDALKAMAAFWQEAFGSMMGGQGENPIELFEAIDGFPVVAREMSGDKVESETLLKSAEQADLGADAFKPPADYKLQEMGAQ